MYTKPIGFWGLVVEPGKMYSQEVPVSFKMTMATLGPEAYESSSSSKVASEPVKKASRTIVMMTHDKDGEFALCSLHPDKHDQQSLDFVFMQGEMIHLRVMGDDAVHLSGYYFDEIESNPLLGGYDAEELEAELNGEDVGSEEEEDDDESDEESDSEDGHEECGEECDSEMDDFINDDDIEEEEDLDSKVKARNLKMNKTGKNPRVIEVASSEEESDASFNEDEDEDEEDEEEDEEDEEEDEEEDDEEEDETVKDKEHHKRNHRRLEKLASAPLTESEDDDLEDDEEIDSDEDDEEIDSDEDDEEIDSDDNEEIDSEDDEEIDSDEAGSDLDSENDDEEEAPILVCKGSEKKRHVIPVEEPAKKAKTQAEPVPVKKAESPKQAIATSSKNSSPIASKENTPSKGNETLFVKTLPNGLKIEDTRIGQGIKAQKGRQCTIHYTIVNEKGKVLSSTQGKEALSFVLGDSAKLQKALGMGIQGMALGGERKLTIPSEIVQEGIQPALPKSGTCTVTVKLENCQPVAKTA